MCSEMMENVVGLGAKVKQIREKRGMSISELARRANVSRAYLYLIESDKTNPTLQIVSRIATALEVSVNELNGQEDNYKSMLEIRVAELEEKVEYLEHVINLLSGGHVFRNCSEGDK